MRIRTVTATERFVGTADRPLQVVALTVVNAGPDAWTREAPATARVAGDGLTVPDPVRIVDVAPGWEATVEIGVAVDPRVRPGDQVDAQVDAVAGERGDRRGFTFGVAEPGWRMFMVPHFHYDPVWWNTQAAYTETWEKRPLQERPWEGRRQQPAFALVDAHLDLALRDPDYRFVLAELDYLKPYWDVFPERRADLRQLMAEGRLELVGGTYNEASTNLTSIESTIRNAVYGIGYQRDVLGGDPATAWQLDVFGHDPQFPGLMADAGLTSSSWARGPFHQWGPSRVVGGNTRMQFPSEFMWVSPGGGSVLTSYMPNHYSAGWELDAAPTLAAAEAVAFRLFTELKAVAATRNVLLPVGSDYTPPNRWIMQIHRDWNARYRWPRFEVALPRDFFAAVRAALAGPAGATPQTRDMNPIYTGKDVSYIDTKQAQRGAESTLFAAEAFATVAALLGARYPAEAVDKAWRQLLFNAHHDGITGTGSDQVYLDLVGGWREAWELAREVRDGALDRIGRHIDSRGGGQPLAVFNPLSWTRTDIVRAGVELAEPAPGLRLVDDTGTAVPFVIESERRDDAGRLISCALAFVATEVPSVGYRTYRLHPAGDLPTGARWQRVPGDRIRNACYELAVDGARGGAICDLVDLTAARAVLKPGELAGELLAYEEYPTHPEQGEGPWHLLTTGAVESAATNAATVQVERSAIGERVVARSGAGRGVAGCTTVQETALYAGADRVECTLRLDGFERQDVLLRMRVAADVEGGMPISEVGNAVIGRGFGMPLADAAQFLHGLDNAASNWFGVGATARVALRDPGDDHERASRALSVAEIVAPGSWVASDAVRDLVVAFVRSGVTATVSRCTGSRYGSIDTDSNLPDVRVVIGGEDVNTFAAELLAEVDPGYRDHLQELLATHGVARVWIPARRPLHDVWRPGADLRGARDLPVLLVAGVDGAATRAAVAELCTDLADSVVEIEQPRAVDGATGRVDDYTVAVCNQGIPSFTVDARGDLHLSFLRSCSGWPAGVWLDPPPRTAPDGSSFQFQHWTHEFRYALVAGAGDWRQVGVDRAAREHNHPMIVRTLGSNAGPLPGAASFVTVDSDDVALTAMKPLGNPMARMAGTEMDPSDGIALRLSECHGRSADARVHLFQPLRDAFVTDLLEQAGGRGPDARRPAEVVDGTLRHRLDPYAIATVGVVVDVSPAHPPRPASQLREPVDGDLLARRQEPAQPVFSDYWLHNKGAAPVGYQPVTVRVPPRAIATDTAFDLPVVVASERTDADVAGTVDVIVPDGWRAVPATHAYRLAPGAHASLAGSVTPAAGAAPGRYFVAARIRDDAGQVHEDVVTVDYRSDALAWDADVDTVARGLLLDRVTRGAVVVDREPDPATMAVLGGEMRAQVRNEALVVGSGERRWLEVTLRNLVRDEVRGEAQLVSPWGTWEQTAPWTQGFAVPPAEDVTVRFSVQCPEGLPPSSTWALVKIMYFGRVLYTPAVALVLGSRHGPATGS